MPKITEITVSAGRVIPHPFTQYANLRPMVTLKAEVLPGEDFETITRDLQAKVEGMIEDHSRSMVKSLEELEDLTRRQAKVASLESSIRRAQMDLDLLRKDMPALADLTKKDKEPDEEPEYDYDAPESDPSKWGFRSHDDR